MTTTSEKILSEMERMGKIKIKDLCAQIGWQYQKFRRRIKANDFSDKELELIAASMNALQKYLPPPAPKPSPATFHCQMYWRSTA